MSNYIVIDLEMCQLSKKEKAQCALHHEIIQIGAVCIDENLNISGSFQTYVHPKNGKVNNLIHSITKITQNDLSDAPDLSTAIKQFMEWIPQDPVMISWSYSDISQLRRELKTK